MDKHSREIFKDWELWSFGKVGESDIRIARIWDVDWEG